MESTPPSKAEALRLKMLEMAVKSLLCSGAYYYLKQDGYIEGMAFFSLAHIVYLIRSSFAAVDWVFALIEETDDGH